MLVIILCFLIGIALGLFIPSGLPASATQYIAIAILAGLDSVFGGFSATINNNFKLIVFITGLFGNAALAILLTFIG